MNKFLYIFSAIVAGVGLVALFYFSIQFAESKKPVIQEIKSTPFHTKYGRCEAFPVGDHTCVLCHNEGMQCVKITVPQPKVTPTK